MTPKKLQKGFLLLLLLFLLLTPLASLMLRRQTQADVQYYEQRNPAVLPAAEAKTLLDGSFFTELESAVSARLALRPPAIRSYFQLILLLGRPGVNDSVVNAEVMLGVNSYARWDDSSLYGEAEEIAADYAELNSFVEEYGGYFCYVGLPLQTFYYTEYYPAYMENRLWHLSVLRDAFSTAMAEAGVPFIEMNAVFRSMEGEEPFYPQTDHHFTYYGAYVTAQEIMARIRADTGWTVSLPERGALDWRELPNPYLGSRNRTLYGLWESTDRLAVAYPEEEISFRRWDNGVESPAELFRLPETDTEPVTYSLYMGGDMAETVIRTDREELPDVLVYGDSFTNPLETLLYMGFHELRSLDFRYYSEKTLREYIAEYQPDVVICVRDESAYFSRELNGSTD